MFILRSRTFHKLSIPVVTFLSLLILLTVFLSPKPASALVTFEKTFGGNDNDSGYSVQQTTDGGYITLGHTYSFGAGNVDMYLVKTDSNGNKSWSQTFGGSGWDYGRSVQQTADGGYIILGYTQSFGAGYMDMYLVKTDANGVLVSGWGNRGDGTSTFGGSFADNGYSVQQLAGGGYILLGYSNSFGAGYEMYLVKVDANGNEIWGKTFGGSIHEYGYSVQQTTDGGFILLGDTTSFGAGGSDMYLVKTDSNGNKSWSQTFGGSNYDMGYSVQQTADDGYIVLGMSRDFSVDGDYDMYLVKTDSSGNEIWGKTFGGTGSEEGRSVQQTTDGGYILFGTTDFFDPTTYDMYMDMYLVKTDSSGDAIWSKTFDGTGYEMGNSVQQTTDGGYILFGTTDSGGIGTGEMYLIKTDANGNASAPNTPPITEAGENIMISTEEIYLTVIQGSGATADTDDVLSYRWLEGVSVLLDWTPAGANGECPLNLSATSLGAGTHTLTLEVTDGQGTSSDNMILTIDNSAPHPAPIGAGVYEINNAVTLSGDVSDFDGDLLSYEWKEGTEVLFSGSVQAVAGGSPVMLPVHSTSSLSFGLHTIVLIVNDGINAPVSSEIIVEIVDTSVPTLGPVPSQTIMWPPNHNMVDITIDANASDNSGLPLTLTTVVTSNEPEDGLGDGDIAQDWSVADIDQDTGIISLQLRSERSGSGDGRVYTITITATDRYGNSSTANLEIIVPHDKKKNK